MVDNMISPAFIIEFLQSKPEWAVQSSIEAVIPSTLPDHKWMQSTLSCNPSVLMEQLLLNMVPHTGYLASWQPAPSCCHIQFILMWGSLRLTPIILHCCLSVCLSTRNINKFVIETLTLFLLISTPIENAPQELIKHSLLWKLYWHHLAVTRGLYNQ